jgi:hypothetical protein
LYHADKLIVFRAADVLEKVTKEYPQYLKKHKKTLIKLCRQAIEKEMKWHCSLLVSRLTLSEIELGIAWHLLTGWALDVANSRIVRVNALQALFNLLNQQPELEQDFMITLKQLESANIASINARIRLLKIQMRKAGAQ